jgi:hypothetical protein
VQGDITALDVLKGARGRIERDRPLVWCEGPAGGPEEEFLCGTLGGAMLVRTHDDMIVCFDTNVKSRKFFRTISEE